jgi:hypothetical protein
MGHLASEVEEEIPLLALGGHVCTCPDGWWNATLLFRLNRGGAEDAGEEVGSALRKAACVERVRRGPGIAGDHHRERGLERSELRGFIGDSLGDLPGLIGLLVADSGGQGVAGGIGAGGGWQAID